MKQRIVLTENKLRKLIKECVKNILFESKDIELPEYGSVPVMEWLRDNGSPFFEQQIFSYDGQPFAIVSSQYEDETDTYLEWVDQEGLQWHDINGMKRLRLRNGEWLLCIEDKLYIMTTYKP